MTRYVLDDRYGLRGWQGLPFVLWDRIAKSPDFLPKEAFLALLRCDGIEDIDVQALPEDQQAHLAYMTQKGIIHECASLMPLMPYQSYRTFPCRFKSNVHWSITGRCNFSCKHCMVSAPHAKFGHPTTAQLLDIVDQMAECGIGYVTLTGGEPLIREDFWEIVDALCAKDIGISVIFSNGHLVNEALLDGLEARGLRPGFQMSHDGVGWHDWLRGFEGAEASVDRAFRLLQERGWHADAAMCLHRRNAHTLRETVNHLAELGVSSLKVNCIQELGEWQDAAKEVALSQDEALQAYLDYLPHYFEDGMPLDLTLDGAFTYERDEGLTSFGYERHCGVDPEGERRLSCSSLRTSMYVGPDGRVCPCMAMTVQEEDEAFPSLFETPLREILGNTPFMERCSCTIGQVRDANPECRECAWVDHCHGGCRAAAYNSTGRYYGLDPDQCHFFKQGWYERFRRVVEEHGVRMMELD